MMKAIWLDAKQWGWKGTWIFALIILFLGLVAFLIALPELGADTTPTESDSDIIIAPKSGVGGYDVEPFCTDPLTKVTALPAPDAGITYQLLRERDKITETVVVVFNGTTDPTTGTHYYDTVIGQDSEPAVVNEKARDCIKSKAK